MGRPGESYNEDGEKPSAPLAQADAPNSRAGSPQFYDQDEIEAAEPPLEPSSAKDEDQPRTVVDIYALVRERQGFPVTARGRRVQAGAPSLRGGSDGADGGGDGGGGDGRWSDGGRDDGGRDDGGRDDGGRDDGDGEDGRWGDRGGEDGGWQGETARQNRNPVQRVAPPPPPPGPGSRGGAAGDDEPDLYPPGYVGLGAAYFEGSPFNGPVDAPTQLDVFRLAPVIAQPPPAPPVTSRTASEVGPASPPPPPPSPESAPPRTRPRPAPPTLRRAEAPPDPLPPPGPAPAGEEYWPGAGRRFGGLGGRRASSNFGRNTGIVAAGTFLSRITGFARTLTILAVLGSTGLGDAYNLANTVPNIVYELVLGGVLSATMIPVFVEQFRREDRAAGQRSISAVLTAITTVLVVVTLLLYLFAPAVIHFYLLFNHHQVTGGDERAIGTSLLRLFAPQVLFLGAIVVTTALLNARRHFAAPAFSPVVNNVIMIVAILATKLVASTLEIGPFRHDHSAILVLGLGTTFGYFVQFLIHLPALARAGVRIRPVWDFRDPAVRQITRLSSWLVGVVLANQVSLTVVIILAAQVPGSFTVYSAAFTFFQLPYAIFAVSLASVLTPDLAERWTAGDRTGFRHRMIAGTRVTLAVMIPAGIGYAIVARPVILLAAHHGATSAASAHLLASSLALFAIGLPGYSAFLLLLRGLQAMQDAKAMFGVYLLENAMSVVLAFALYPALGVRGLVLAWVMPYTFCSFVVIGQLRRRMGPFGGYRTVRALLRISVSTGIMAVAVFGVARILPHGDGDAALALRLIAQVVVGAVVYLYSARVFGLGELDPILALAGRLFHRLTDSPPPRRRPPGGPSPTAQAPRAPASSGRSRPPIGRHVRVD